MYIRRISVLFPCVLLCVACCTSTAQGKELSQKMGFKDFSKLNISGPFDVEIKRSDKFEVTYVMDQKHMDKVDTRIEGDTLKIRMNNHKGCTRCEMLIKIRMPKLKALELNGAADASITGFKSSSDFHLGLSGACSLTGDIQAGNAYFDLSGASDIELTGSAKDLALEASGASDADLEQFAVIVATVDSSGASDAIINVSKELSVELSGASDLTYYGNPTLKSVDTSGASSLRRR